MAEGILGEAYVILRPVAGAEFIESVSKQMEVAGAAGGSVFGKGFGTTLAKSLLIGGAAAIGDLEEFVAKRQTAKQQLINALANPANGAQSYNQVQGQVEALDRSQAKYGLTTTQVYQALTQLVGGLHSFKAAAADINSDQVAGLMHHFGLDATTAASDLVKLQAGGRGAAQILASLGFNTKAYTKDITEQQAHLTTYKTDLAKLGDAQRDLNNLKKDQASANPYSTAEVQAAQASLTAANNEVAAAKLSLSAAQSREDTERTAAGRQSAEFSVESAALRVTQAQNAAAQAANNLATTQGKLGTSNLEKAQAIAAAELKVKEAKVAVGTQYNAEQFYLNKTKGAQNIITLQTKDLLKQSAGWATAVGTVSQKLEQLRAQFENLLSGSAGPAVAFFGASLSYNLLKLGPKLLAKAFKTIFTSGAGEAEVKSAGEVVGATLGANILVGLGAALTGGALGALFDKAVANTPFGKFFYKNGTHGVLGALGNDLSRGGAVSLTPQLQNIINRDSPSALATLQRSLGELSPAGSAVNTAILKALDKQIQTNKAHRKNPQVVHVVASKGVRAATKTPKVTRGR